MPDKIKIKKTDGYTISAIKEIPDEPRGIVIVIHGFASCKESATYQMLIRKFPKAGYGMIGIDLPGHGTEESATEPLRIEGCLNSIEAAERYAREQWPDVPVSYFGSSFGAYLTGLYISLRDHAGRKAFFRSGAVNMPELFTMKHSEPSTKCEGDTHVSCSCSGARGEAKTSLDKEKPIRLSASPSDEDYQRMQRELDEKGYFITGEELGKPMKVTRDFCNDLEAANLFELFDPKPAGEHRIAMAHGMEDNVIDPEAAKQFAKKFGIPITFFPGEGHSLGNDPATPEKVAELAIALYEGKNG